jgi:DNA-binding transcriptional ArsR family regulator
MQRGLRDEDGDGQTRDESQRMSPPLLQALNHPIRRETLRLLHRSVGPRSAVQLSPRIATVKTNVSYHLKVLAKFGAVERVDERHVRGAPEKLFASAVAGHRQVLAILADTEVSDDAIRR